MQQMDLRRLGEATADPLRFCAVCWPTMRLYDKQRDILHSVRDNFETFVHAANEMGKSRIAAVSALWFFATRTPARVISSSSTEAQLEKILWTEIRSLIATSRLKFPFEVTHLSVFKLDSQGHRQPLDYLIGSVTNTVESFQGHHLPNDKPRVLWIGDESSAIEDEYEHAADSWAHRKLLIGNPLSTTNFFYRKCKMGDAKDPVGRAKLLRRVIHIDGLDSPNVKVGLEYDRLGIPGRPPMPIPGLLSYDEYRRRTQEWDEVTKTMRLRGRFYEGEQAMLFPANWLDIAQAHWGDLRRQNKPRKARAMGVDGAEGRDMTCWTIVDDDGIIKQIARQTPDTMEIVSETIRYAEDYDISPRNIVFDGGGGGKQISDRLRQMGWRVKVVMFGGSTSRTDSKAKGKRKEKEEVRVAYKNRRAEMYGNLRKLLNPHSDRLFAIPDDAHELREELVILPLQYDQEGKMYLPPKDARGGEAKSHEVTLRKLLGRSPDRADSLVLACDGLYSARFAAMGEGGEDFDKKVAEMAGKMETTFAERMAEKLVKLG